VDVVVALADGGTPVNLTIGLQAVAGWSSDGADGGPQADFKGSSPPGGAFNPQGVRTDGGVYALLTTNTPASAGAWDVYLLIVGSVAA
jgi:hypothetical protein